MWAFYSVMAMLVWGIEDIFLKMSSEKGDKDFNLKIAVSNGVLSILCFIFATANSESGASLYTLISADVTVLLAIIIYIAVLIVSFIGAYYMEISVFTPIADASGGFSVLMIILFLWSTGSKSEVSKYLTPACISGIILTILGVVTLAFLQNRISDSGKEKTKLSVSTVAVLFPIGFCLVDALSTCIDSVNMGAEGEAQIGQYDYYRIYMAGAFVVGVISWIILLAKNHKPYMPFHRNSMILFSIGICEAIAIVAYLKALGQNAVLSIPISNSYSIVTLIASHIVLKERLRLSQYICIGMVISGIVILSFLGV